MASITCLSYCIRRFWGHISKLPCLEFFKTNMNMTSSFFSFVFGNRVVGKDPQVDLTLNGEFFFNGHL